MAAKYCLKCGYENDEERGACLMCHAPLPVVAGAGQAPVLREGVAPPANPEAMAAAIVDAAGEGFAAAAGAKLDSDYAIAGVAEAGMDDLGGFDEMEAPTEPAAPTVAAEPVPGQVAEAEEEPEAAEELAEEEFVPPPPPPGAVDLELEPPPPPAPGPEPDLVAAEASESEAMAEPPPPPPPPPGVVELEEEPAEEAAEDRPTSDWSIGD